MRGTAVGHTDGVPTATPLATILRPTNRLHIRALSFTNFGSSPLHNGSRASPQHHPKLTVSTPIICFLASIGSSFERAASMGSPGQALFGLESHDRTLILHRPPSPTLPTLQSSYTTHWHTPFLHSGQDTHQTTPGIKGLLAQLCQIEHLGHPLG